ncbi:MAG: SPOR domain-containing protein, partial [Tabrizicola sp.]|nr:SPOR domain-containing protein [Tabrizicola sp.]
MTRIPFRQMLIGLAASGLLAGCVDGAGPLAGKDKAATGGAEAGTGVKKTTRKGDRDVEAPELFQANEKALWDGRPSLGGTWISSPDAKDPQRVMMRNTENGKTVIGALFQRERETPGPKLQVSSDAAAALGMIAGQPAQLAIVALKKEEIVEEVAAEEVPAEVAAAGEAGPRPPEPLTPPRSRPPPLPPPRLTRRRASPPQRQ